MSARRALLRARVAASAAGLCATLALAAPGTAPQAPQTPQALTEPTMAAPYDEALQQLLRELRCVVCQNQSLADSTAPLAQDMKREITQRLAQGQTPEQVRHWLVARYGDFVTYQPPLTAATALLWVVPGLLALAGVATVARAARRLPGPAAPPTGDRA
ncbi:cytochrome c-type biogenesis protein [Aquabacterium sp. OR-4]|uniref:cytochrome c-type biogenesis protein n=1 Tax=Aquabacterium sp. OR-4 TaxID=2978127 RepID=UPI0028C9C0AB|nr:cytochrome c-type biogenesis protein [Aquabacterium sp. OR-4]MDT7838707.1 cytochrome c-type biogenesis protein [Aquabacterium sp. OR-4]